MGGGAASLGLLRPVRDSGSKLAAGNPAEGTGSAQPAPATCTVLELPRDPVAPFPECGSPASGSGASEPEEGLRLPVPARPSELLCPAASTPRTMKAAGSAHSSCIRWIPGRTLTPPSCPRRRPATSTKSSVSGCCARQPAPPHKASAWG